MDLFKKYFSNNYLYALVSDDATYYLKYVNEKPMSFILTPMTFFLLCYYVYMYVRKFYPISVNCWFCNANFKVAFEDRFEFTCISCGQFNGFKEDGSYSKLIPEQHDQRYNQTVFSMAQNDIYESKNGLCHKCNIIQEIKIKQLASFTPNNEKSFDVEVEKFKENLEATLKLCYKCNQYTNKILLQQEQRYNLKSININNQMDMQEVSNWPNVLSLGLSIVILLLFTVSENYLDDWIFKLTNISVFHHNITLLRSVGIVSISGVLCQAYQCLSTMDKLNAIIMLLWSLLFTINNFEILKNFKSKLLVSVFILLLSSISILRILTKKQNIRQINIKLKEEKYNYPSYCDISKNCMSSNSQLRKTHFLPESSNQFIVRLPKYKVARVLNEKIFLEAIPNSIQYTTRDEYDYDIDARYMASEHNVQMDQLKTAMNLK